MYMEKKGTLGLENITLGVRKMNERDSSGYRGLVAINMAKVRKFEDGLKLSIRGKIMGLLL